MIAAASFISTSNCGETRPKRRFESSMVMYVAIASPIHRTTGTKSDAVRGRAKPECGRSLLIWRRLASRSEAGRRLRARSPACVVDQQQDADHDDQRGPEATELRD